MRPTYRLLFAALLLSLAPLARAAAPLLEMPAVDIAAALAADARKAGPQPYRFAVPVPLAAAISPDTAGAWQTLADGRAIWQLRIRSAGASSLNFGFTRYRLPAGAELTVQTADGRERRGPYTERHNGAGQLWTPVLRAEEALIELRLPAASRPQLSLLLGVVNHGFRGFGAKDGVSAKSGSCNIDVACSDGDGWGDEIRSVARYTIAGALLCSGQLVNNTAQDFTPYFLTANHCVSTAAEAPTTVFYWNYQTSRCGAAPDGSLEQTQSGALYLAGSGAATAVGPDFSLLRLLAAPDPSYRVYYSGWDRRDLAPLGVVGIHHPNGDEKRISKDYDQTYVAAYGELPDSTLSSLQATHLMIQSWDRGVTEGGSSGSGIWDFQHHLVGQLSGGASSCDAPKEPDWYGRMAMNFSYLDTPLTSLGFWLDPASTGVETLDGADPNGKAGTGGGSSGGASDGGGGALGAGTLLGMLLALGLRRRSPR